MSNQSSKMKLMLFTITGVLLVAAGFLAAICIGAKSISLNLVFDSIFHYQEENLDMMLIRDSRIPRATASLLIGGMLALTGAGMQGITRNPIADPTILGMSQGATFAVALSIVTLKIAGDGSVVAAMIGAILSGAFVLLISIRSASNMNMSKLLLAGTAASTFLLALASMVAILGNRSQELAFWIAGGLGNTNWSDVRLLLLYGGISSLLLMFLAGKINILSLGEDMAIGLGINPARLRVVTVALMIPITAASVSVSGNIIFVGLIIPHIVRRMVGADYRIVIPLSFLYGAVLLVWADLLARMINTPYETPIGLFTAMLGVPYFLFLVRKERG